MILTRFYCHVLGGSPTRILCHCHPKCMKELAALTLTSAMTGVLKILNWDLGFGNKERRSM